jgi:hypothetical protein
LIKRLKRGAVEQAHPLWMRVLTFACLLMVAGVSFAAAIHMHGQWLPRHAITAGVTPDSSQLPGGEESCPLCLVMHSALPASAHVELVHSVLVECKVVQAVNHAPETLWHYAMFSRPPPVETL